MSKEATNILVFSEFEFAPKVLTVCARTREELFTEIGSQDYPLFGSTIPTHPIATYLPEEALSLFKSRFYFVASHNYGQISEFLPEKWLVGLTDGVKLFGMSAIGIEDLPELVATVEAEGQRVSAFPLPKGVVI